MVLGAIIGGVASAALGGMAASSQARSQNRANAQVAKYNKELWKYNWEQDNRNRDFQIAQNAAQRTNLANERAYSQETQIRDFQYAQQQDTARYNAELAAFRKSDDIFSSQLKLNQAGLDLALKQQSQFMAEQELNYTFRTADLGLQLQSAVDDYTLSMFDESLSRQIADQERDQRTTFANQTRNLNVGQADQNFGLTAQLSNERTAIAKAQAGADYKTTNLISQGRTDLTKSQAADEFGLTAELANERAAITKSQATAEWGLSIENSALRRDLEINQAEQSARLTSKNAQDRFGNQVRNIKSEQDQLRTSTSREQELASIEAMRNKGTAKSGQAGRSSAKLAQSIGFIAGLNQAALTDRILFGERGASRAIADAGLAMQQTVDQSVLEARQRMDSAVLGDQINQKTAGLSLAQTKQSADFANKQTQYEAGLRKDQTFQNADFANAQTQIESGQRYRQALQTADFGNTQTQSEALLRRNQTVDSANLTNQQARTEAEVQRSQAYAASEMRIKRADQQLSETRAKIDLDTSGALASIISARISNEYTNSSIQADKYAADLNAYANRMLEPVAPIARPAPLLLPEAIILDPPKLKKPPKPVAGSNISTTAAFLGGAAPGIGSALAAAIK